MVCQWKTVVFRAASWGLIGFLGVALGIMAGDRADPFVRYGGEIYPANPQPDSQVTIKWTGHRWRECEGEVWRTITDKDDKVHTFAPTPVEYTHTQNPDIMPRTFTLPIAVPPGRATYKAVAKFRCPLPFTSIINPMHYIFPIIVDRPTVDFNVGEPPAPKSGALWRSLQARKSLSLPGNSVPKLER